VFNHSRTEGLRDKTAFTLMCTFAHFRSNVCDMLLGALFLVLCI
jgi:hypothetical protein